MSTHTRRVFIYNAKVLERTRIRSPSAGSNQDEKNAEKIEVGGRHFYRPRNDFDLLYRADAFLVHESTVFKTVGLDTASPWPRRRSYCMPPDPASEGSPRRRTLGGGRSRLGQALTERGHLPWGPGGGGGGAAWGGRVRSARLFRRTGTCRARPLGRLMGGPWLLCGPSDGGVGVLWIGCRGPVRLFWRGAVECPLAASAPTGPGAASSSEPPLRSRAAVDLRLVQPLAGPAAQGH